MKKQRLLELAEQHGIKITRRHFIDVRDEHNKRSTTFIDLPRPIHELERELAAKGVQT